MKYAVAEDFQEESSSSSLGEILFFPAFKENVASGFIEAPEVFEFLMQNLENPLRNRLLATYIDHDKRELSELAIWLLERRGFSSEIIPKMAKAEVLM